MFFYSQFAQIKAGTLFRLKSPASYFFHSTLQRPDTGLALTWERAWLCHFQRLKSLEKTKFLRTQIPSQAGEPGLEPISVHERTLATDSAFLLPLTPAPAGAVSCFVFTKCCRFTSRWGFAGEAERYGGGQGCDVTEILTGAHGRDAESSWAEGRVIPKQIKSSMCSPYTDGAFLLTLKGALHPGSLFRAGAPRLLWS